LSHKLLIFTDYQVFFQSRKKAYREDIFLEMSIRMHDLTTSFILEDLFLNITYGSGGYNEYAQLVSKYTRRRLSYKRDLSNAFRGIMKLFGERIEGTPHDFLWALPIAGLDFALCWDQTPESLLLQPRVIEFPSWSWLGWMGGKHYSDNVARPGPALRPRNNPPYYDQSPILFYQISDIRVLSEYYFDFNPQLPWKPQNAPTNVVPPKVPPGHIIRFWTSSTMLRVRKQSSGHYVIFNPRDSCGEKALGRITLDPDWVAQQPNQELEFVVIASYSRFFRSLVNMRFIHCVLNTKKTLRYFTGE
jgi:hypothetical protein